VVLLGAGVVGEVIARHITNDNNISVTILDINPARLRQVKSKLPTKKVQTHVLNVLDSENFQKVLKDAGLVINAATPKLNSYIMKECLRNNVNYMDLASDDVDEQLEMDSQWKSKGLKAIICMGEDPGLSNIYVKFAASMFKEAISVKIRDGEFSETKKFYLMSLFAPEVFFDELLSPVYYYENGKYVALKPLSIQEEYDFPHPIGRRTFYLLDHEEIWTLPKFIKSLKYADFGLVLSPELVNAVKTLKKIGLLGSKKINVRNKKVVPRDVFYALLPRPNEISKYIRGYAGIAVEISGRDGGLKSYTLYTTVSHEYSYKMFGTNATAYLTGTVPAIVASMLAKGEIELNGVIVPEQLDPEPILKRLQEKHVISYLRTVEEQTLVL